jgi:pimeloyl-ACP methyl ester carboxylesterase
MPLSFQIPILIATTLYHAIASLLENRQPLPGQHIDIGGYCLHLCTAGDDRPNQPTIVLDHSLGGVEGHLLLEELAKISQICIYDRAGYGWSDHSPKPRTSQVIAQELDTLLTNAGIAPPYLLVGDSFGSYNMRLYAHLFPEKVAGLILTDGLHESGMLQMSLPLQLLKAVFVAGFWMAVLGSSLGIIRLARLLGLFELFKPELRPFAKLGVDRAKYSFCRAKHWWTMSQELINLNESGRQVSAAKNLGDLPIVSIKASSFFKPAIWTLLIPLKQANELRDRMHGQLTQLSTRTQTVNAPNSGHFVWVDEPHILLDAVRTVLNQIHL